MPVAHSGRPTEPAKPINRPDSRSRMSPIIFRAEPVLDKLHLVKTRLDRSDGTLYCVSQGVILQNVGITTKYGRLLEGFRMSWTEEKVDQLSKLWGEGYSASAIGKLIGVSKNAVIGKAHRMHLTARPSPIKRGMSVRPMIKPVPVPKPVVEAPPRPTPRPVSKKADGPACLWPIGDPSHSDFHFCGDPSVAGKPYCEHHCEIAYITKPRSSEAA